MQQYLVHRYPVTIKETHLDFFGHVNNAVYLTLFEEARWDLITKNGYGLSKMKESGFGPVILEIHIKFIKELKERDEIVIETQSISHDGKIGRLGQKMLKDGVVCCTLELVIGLFSLTDRKLVMPTDEWLKAVGVNKV